MKSAEVRQTSPQLPGGCLWCWWAQRSSWMLLLEQCGRCWGYNAFFGSHASLGFLSLWPDVTLSGSLGVVASFEDLDRARHTRQIPIRICSSLYAGVSLPYGASRTLCNIAGHTLETGKPRDRRASGNRESTRVSASGHSSSAGGRDVQREHRASARCTLFPTFCDWTWSG